MRRRTGQVMTMTINQHDLHRYSLNVISVGASEYEELAPHGSPDVIV
jgi:hypothetical protein